MYLDDVQIMQFMISTDRLAIDHPGAPDACVFKGLGQVLMNGFCQVKHGAPIRHGERILLDEGLARLLAVDAQQMQQLEDI